jgi:hypothetical protein
MNGVKNRVLSPEVQFTAWGCIGFDVGSDTQRRMPSALVAR